MFKTERQQPNQPGAVNGGIALGFHVEAARPAVTDPVCWATHLSV
jgi:hypothetical protein